jgi:hypothetical protein
VRHLTLSATVVVAALAVAGCGGSGSQGAEGGGSGGMQPAANTISSAGRAVGPAEAKAAFQAVGLRATIVPGTRYNRIACNGAAVTIAPRYVYMAAALVRPFRYQDTLSAVVYRTAAAAQACARSVVKPQYVIAITGGARGVIPKVVRVNSTTEDVIWPDTGGASSGPKGATGSWTTVITSGPVMMVGIAANRPLSETLQAQMQRLAPKLVS